MTLVSVVMNCRNGERFLEEALKSALGQSHEDLEIVFWDNQSTDSSAEIAQSLGPRVRYFMGEESLPLGAARNEALARCRGEYVAILDVDDRWEPPKLELQLQAMRSPDVGLCYTNMKRVDGAGRTLSVWTNERPLHTGWVLRELLADCFISMSTILVRRDVFDRVGVFPPGYHMVEEWDLYLRIAEAYRLEYVGSEPLVVERQHEGQASRQYDLLVEEVVHLMDAWALRRPELEHICRTSASLFRFKRALLRGYQALERRDWGAALLETGLAMLTLSRRPIGISRAMLRFLHRDNRRFLLNKAKGEA